MKLILFIYKTLKLIDKEIFQTLINIPKDFGKLQHIRDISEVRHQQVQQIQQVQQVQQVQQEPLTINKFKKKMNSLFINSTINKSLLKIEIDRIKEKLNKLNLEQYPNPIIKQQKLLSLYQELGIRFAEVLRKSKEKRNL